MWAKQVAQGSDVAKTFQENPACNEIDEAHGT